MRSIFEVAIFNQQVRDALADGRHHRQLNDEWGDLHFIEVRAANREDARAIMMRRYSPNQGYVIDDIREIG